MKFSIPEFSVRRPVCIFICVLSLIIFGTTSIFDMPMESTPEMEMPVMMVMTSYPNASPDEVDQAVTDVIEGSLATISGVDTIMSQSSEGMSMTVLQFDYDTDMDEAYSDMSSALAMVRLPDDCSDPTLIEMALDNSAIMSLSVATDDANSQNLLNYVEDNIIPEIERIDGIAQVDTSGGSRQYVQVLLDENALTQYGLTMSQVASAISSAEYETTLGQLDRGNVSLELIGSQEYNNYRLLGEVPITLPSGDIIHVSDVATVSLKTESGGITYRENGHESISINISKEQSANTVEICNEVADLVNEMNASGNLGVEIEIFSNSADDIVDNIRSVVTSLLEGLVIAVIVLKFFLGDWKASMIVALSMPFSVLFTLIIMSFMGMSLNLISLGGLVIGVGMLVDNSIVVIDSCFKSQSPNLSIKDAVIQGSNIVFGAVVASTLTTVVVFLPIAMIDGMTGELARDLCYTIVFSLTASLVSAVTLVPLLFVRLKPREKRRTLVARGLRRVEYAYGNLMKKLLYKKALVVCTALVLAASAIALFTQVDMELMPAMNSSNINISVEMKTGLNEESSNAIMEEIERVISSNEYVDSYSVSGSGSASVTLKDDAPISQDEFVRQLEEATDDLDNCVVTVNEMNMLSFSGGNNVQINLQGPNLTDLETAAGQLESMMDQMGVIEDVSTSLSDGSPRAKIEVDPILSGSVGMTPASVLADVRNKLSGASAGNFQDGDTEYDITVEYDPERFENISDLYGLMVDLPTGGQVALTDIATIKYETAPTSITREDGDYLVTVTGELIDGVNAANVSGQVMQMAAALSLPEGVEFYEGGSMEMMAEEFSAIGKALLIAVYLVFAVMAIQFESLRFSLVVMISVPFAFTGSLLALYLTGQTINMTSLLGFIMLAGIVVNNAIVLVDFTNQLRRDRGMEIHQALVFSGRSRLRPILMSTLTTVVGLIPMAFASDVDMMAGMAIVVIGGLTFSTLLTLIFIPTMYLIFDKEDRQTRKAIKKQKREANRSWRKDRRKERVLAHRAEQLESSRTAGALTDGQEQDHSENPEEK